MTRYQRLKLLVKIRRMYRGGMTWLVILFMFLVYVLFYPIKFFTKEDSSCHWDHVDGK